MSLFKRLFNIGSAAAHSAVESLEDPVKLTEQGIRNLKSDLNDSLKGLAEVKAIAIRAKREVESNKALASDYERKALLLLQKAQSGEIAQEEADRLASEALSKKTQALTLAETNTQNLVTHEASVAKMEQNVQKIKSQISHWENEAKTLKARAKVSEASKKINKHLSNIDSSGTVAMLERMKEKVEQQEALAESYGSIADENKSVDDEIDAALGSGGTQNLALEELKAKMKRLDEGKQS